MTIRLIFPPPRSGHYASKGRTAGRLPVDAPTWGPECVEKTPQSERISVPKWQVIKESGYTSAKARSRLFEGEFNETKLIDPGLDRDCRDCHFCRNRRGLFGHASRSHPFLYQSIFLTQHLFKESGTFFGVDSTGMELDHASHHYCKRINRKKPVKGFVNLNALSDLHNKIIITTKIRKKRRHDCSDFLPMWNKVKHLDFDYFVADKGYDSETNHKAVFQAGKQSLIYLKYMGLPSYKTKGEYRKKAKREFEQGLYTQREITESIFSSLKRKYGSKLRARNFKTQKVELLFKILSYNVERSIRDIPMEYLMLIGL